MKRFTAIILLVTVFASACLFSTGCTATDNNPTDTDKETITDNNPTDTDKETITDNNPTDTDEETIVGTWIGGVDFAPFLFEDEDDDFTKYLEMDKFTVTVIFCFNADNTWELSVDEDAFEETCEEAMEALTDATVKYIEDMLKESDTGLTIEDYEEKIGMSIEDYCSNRYDTYDIFDDDFITGSGVYSFDGTELFFGEGPVYTIDLDRDTLDFTGCSDMDDDTFTLLRTAVFKRSR